MRTDSSSRTLEIRQSGIERGTAMELGFVGPGKMGINMELAAGALAKDPGLKKIKGWVADSGEGRWTGRDAIEMDVALPLFTLSLTCR
jgi:6-phosphogluconate dehydrogenase